jgi:hypothetical protein
MVDLHAQTLLDPSAGRVHFIFLFPGMKIVVKEGGQSHKQIL